MSTVATEPIRNPARFTNEPLLTKAECETAIRFILQKIDENLPVFTDKFPAPASKNNVYAAIENVDWTASFWTGMLWLAYEITGDQKYRQAAEVSLLTFYRRLDNRIGLETHDLGFLYTLSCVAAHKLTGNQTAKEYALKAADFLMVRYFDNAGIIQAWGDLNDPNQRGRMIIDCLMNLPLLYWASDMTGNRAYYDAALSHVRQAARYIVRPDASTFHTFYMDVETGAPKFGKTAQGFSDASCWARGQAWAMYGFPLSYRYVRDRELIELNHKLTSYFLNRLPEDHVCYWDLIFTEGAEERDSSAAAIAVCGLLEMTKSLPLTDPARRVYEHAAVSMIRSLAASYTSAACPNSNGILLHAVYGKPMNDGVDECCIWGDYFYFEALVRLLKDWQLYW
ncbi:glycosyl hydrolase family 88 [Candidatus Moduliflexus flocculans]|uniref:Glycosyl hydrolase family 88 n=1 Tax=Candidatus Moduliflexus flocculans TaxID=1499966 RepID=A0A081BP89_9BACT|nr:glycosyl hydrolase family 88 [Candidatus Moduliflexus flocculans]